MDNPLLSVDRYQIVSHHPHCASFANDDGSSRQEVGSPASDSMAVSGSYSFVTPEGEVIS